MKKIFGIFDCRGYNNGDSRYDKNKYFLNGKEVGEGEYYAMGNNPIKYYWLSENILLELFEK